MGIHIWFRYPDTGRLPTYPAPIQPPPYPYPANGSPLGSPPGYSPVVPGALGGPGAAGVAGTPGVGFDRKKRVEFAEPLIQNEEENTSPQTEPCSGDKYKPEIKGTKVEPAAAGVGFIGSIFPRLTGSSQPPEVDPSKKIFVFELFLRNILSLRFQ